MAESMDLDALQAKLMAWGLGLKHVRAWPKSIRAPTIFVNIAFYRDPECGVTVGRALLLRRRNRVI